MPKIDKYLLYENRFIVYKNMKNQFDPLLKKIDSNQKFKMKTLQKHNKTDTDLKTFNTTKSS